MPTDDAPRPALDAVLLGQLRWAVEQLRGVRYRAEGDYFRAETIILNNADPLLVAAAERDVLAGECAHALTLLEAAEGMDWLGKAGVLRDEAVAVLRAALAPADGAGGSDDGE